MNLTFQALSVLSQFFLMLFSIVKKIQKYVISSLKPIVKIYVHTGSNSLKQIDSSLDYTLLSILYLISTFYR